MALRALEEEEKVAGLWGRLYDYYVLHPEIPHEHLEISEEDPAVLAKDYIGG